MEFAQNVTSKELVAETRFQHRDFDMDDYMSTVEDLCKKFGTNQNMGLSHEVAERNLAYYGENVVYPTRKRQSEILRFCKCAFYEVALLYWITAIIFLVNLLVHYYVMGDVPSFEVHLCAAMVVNGIAIGLCTFLQGRTDKFSHLPKPPTKPVEVIRDGESVNVAPKDLVMGDLVILKQGDFVPADIRMIKKHNIKVDQFQLTGVRDQYLLQEMLEGNPSEAGAVAYYASKVVEGYGQGIVVRTGRYTLAARALLPRHLTEELICPITREVMLCLNSSVIVCTAVGLFIFLLFVIVEKGSKATDPFLVLIVVILNAVPSNLLLTLVISLSINSRRLALHYCTPDNIICLERLPFVSTICLSKPGVLTQNKVNVSNLWFDKKLVEVWSGSRIVWKDKSSQTFRELALCAVLCNEAEFQEDEEDKPILKRKMKGNENDVAILRLMLNIIGKKVERLRESYPRVYWVPYAQLYNYQCSVHKAGERHLLIMIGEPERLLRRCTTFALDGTDVEVNGDFRRAIDKACIQFAKFTETIKCVIDQTITDTEDFKHFRIPKSGFRFVGMITLSDPPRTGLAQAVTKFRQAGIKVVLMTNDHPIAARSFARQIGVIGDNSKTVEELAEGKSISEKQKAEAVVVDVTELKKMSMKKVEALTDKCQEVVFTRTNAAQRMLLVSALQMRQQSIVAMVGDLSVDHLAMMKSDVSVTYRGEYNFAKSSADLYITDDSFLTLASGVEEGRTIYENLRKSCAFLFASNAPAVSAMIAFCMLGFPLPMSPIGFLIVQTVTDLFPSVALTFEKNDSDVMARQPEHFYSGRFWSWAMIFNSCMLVGSLETAACFFAYFTIMLMYGWTPLSLFDIRDMWDSSSVNNLRDTRGQEWSYSARKILEMTSQTGFFFALVLMQAANVLACRSQRKSIVRMQGRNWFIHFGILLQLSLTFFFIYVPFLSILTPLDPLLWLLPLPFVLALVLYDEGKKFFIRKFPDGFAARELCY